MVSAWTRLQPTWLEQAGRAMYGQQGCEHLDMMCPNGYLEFYVSRPQTAENDRKCSKGVHACVSARLTTEACPAAVATHTATSFVAQGSWLVPACQAAGTCIVLGAAFRNLPQLVACWKKGRCAPSCLTASSWIQRRLQHTRRRRDQVLHILLLRHSLC